MQRLTSLFLGWLLVCAIGWLALYPPSGLAQLERFPQESGMPKTEDEGPRLPNGKLQRDVILKHEHQRNLDELKEIRKLSDELIEDLETNTEFVLSLKSLKKLERMEKLTRDVRKRVQK
jgi:hypothetical protein